MKHVSYDTQYFRCLDVHCLHSDFLGKNAPEWPWQWVTLALFPCSLPLHQYYIKGITIFGMLFMSELEGIPSCWILSPISLKTSHQKWDIRKWVTQLSPEFGHFSLSTTLTGKKQDMSYIGLFITDGGILQHWFSWELWSGTETAIVICYDLA